MAARERRHAAAAASAGAAFVDPLASVPAGALFAYASRFGPNDDARPSPHAAGIAAGLARLEALLLNEPPPGAHHVPPPPQAPTQQHQQQSPARDVDGSLSTAAALIAARVRSAVCVPLAPEEADALAHDLDAAPSAALTAGVTPLQLPSLVEANPRVAAAFVAACGSSGPPAMLAAYLLHLLPSRGGGSGGGGGNERSTTGGIMGSGLQSRGGGGGGGGDGGGGGGGDDDDSGERGGVTGKGGVCDSTRGVLFAGGGGGGGVSPPQHAPRPLHSASLDAQAVGGVYISGGGDGGEGVKKALLTLRNLEVVHELLLRSHRAATSPTSTFTMPRDFVGLHLAHAMAAADSATSVGGITRAVRLVCSFAHALHRDGFLRTGGGGSGVGGGSVAGVGEDSCAERAGVTPPQDDGGDEGERDLCVGLTAFALAHVRVREAAELYRVLVTLTPVQSTLE